jgi:5-methylcytosine-specific restriction endonuclease McrA
MQEDRENELEDFISRCRVQLKDALREKNELDLEKYKKHNSKPKIQESRKKYQKSEKGLYSASQSSYNRRTRFEKSCEDLLWHEKKEIGRFYKHCPEGYEVDHIIPIARGGKHTLSNLQYLTKEENRRKGAKLNYIYDKEIN